MRRPLLLVAVLALAAAAPAAAATRDVDLPALFAPVLPQVKARTLVPVLVPDRMPYDGGKLYVESAARPRGWRLDAAAAPGCHQATACFVAELRARRGARPSGRRRVRLRDGRTGWFTPLSCGASCAPPQIAWRQHGAAYWIQARVGTGRTEKRILVRMANQAIRHGAR